MIGIGLLCGNALGAFVIMVFHRRTCGGVGTLCIEARESQISFFFFFKEKWEEVRQGQSMIEGRERGELGGRSCTERDGWQP